jgi:type II secretory pathway component PulL
MVRSVVLAIALLLPSIALAQNQPGPHTQKDEDACDRDAHRFCKELIPDQLRVLACLQENRPKLSKACQGVLQSHGV